VVTVSEIEILLVRLKPSQHFLPNHLAFNAHGLRTVPVARLRSIACRDQSEAMTFKAPAKAARSGQCGHGMIGTLLMAFAGEPLTIFVLIAR
jgi:hypothetical protein